MPRKKIKLEDISVEDAFAALELHGIQAQVKSVESVIPLAVKQQPDIFEMDYTQYPPIQKVGASALKITLYAKHSIGSGGVAVGTKDGKQIENAGVQTYGPGICYVPTALAAQLLHQDAMARQADERMLDKQHRQYLVVQRINSDGYRANVGLQVPDGTLDNLGLLADNMVHIIR